MIECLFNPISLSLVYMLKHKGPKVLIFSKGKTILPVNSCMYDYNSSFGDFRGRDN